MQRLLRRGTPEGTRTPNPQNRNLVLYPLSHGRICDRYVMEKSALLLYHSLIKLQHKNLRTSAPAFFATIP